MTQLVADMLPAAMVGLLLRVQKKWVHGGIFFRLRVAAPKRCSVYQSCVHLPANRHSGGWPACEGPGAWKHRGAWSMVAQEAAQHGLWRPMARPNSLGGGSEYARALASPQLSKGGCRQRDGCL